MPAAMRAADLAVMRSGASALAEPPAAALPAVLVPGGYAGAHQHYNAAFMQSRGAAVLLEEGKLGDLATIVADLLDNGERLRAMSVAAAALAKPDAARAIAEVLLEAAA
jgi:UDP-N-acetylglucosamine--N-acetylmuramyl-(pentapeptide) pyrophosphoryl-undecaprenol N-acetylglucosamine transferase